MMGFFWIKPWVLLGNMDERKNHHQVLLPFLGWTSKVRFHTHTHTNTYWMHPYTNMSRDLTMV